jgi:hypothetical protein
MPRLKRSKSASRSRKNKSKSVRKPHKKSRSHRRSHRRSQRRSQRRSPPVYVQHMPQERQFSRNMFEKGDMFKLKAGIAGGASVLLVKFLYDKYETARKELENYNIQIALEQQKAKAEKLTGKDYRAKIQAWMPTLFAISGLVGAVVIYNNYPDLGHILWGLVPTSDDLTKNLRTGLQFKQWYDNYTVEPLTELQKAANKYTEELKKRSRFNPWNLASKQGMQYVWSGTVPPTTS